ncbi:hypothetical protein LPJ57_011314, partial [Coemansia sp. RSA 486]
MICFTKTIDAIVLAMVAVASVGAVANPEPNAAVDAAHSNVLKRAPCGCGGWGNNWGNSWNRCGGCG